MQYYPRPLHPRSTAPPSAEYPGVAHLRAGDHRSGDVAIINTHMNLVSDSIYTTWHIYYKY